MIISLTILTFHFIYVLLFYQTISRCLLFVGI